MSRFRFGPIGLFFSGMEDSLLSELLSLCVTAKRKERRKAEEKTRKETRKEGGHLDCKPLEEDKPKLT